MKKNSNNNLTLNTFNLKLLFLLVILLLTAIGQPSTVFAQQKDNLSSVIVYPNPVRTTIGHTQATFDNLTNNANIKIFKINGDVVREINATDTAGTVIWDLTNDQGQKVGSAVYIYLITNELGQKVKGKLAVIR